MTPADVCRCGHARDQHVARVMTRDVAELAGATLSALLGNTEPMQRYTYRRTRVEQKSGGLEPLIPIAGGRCNACACDRFRLPRMRFLRRART